MVISTVASACWRALARQAVLLVGGLSGLAGPSFGQHFVPAATYAVGPTAQTIALADVNGDGRADLLTASSGSNAVSVLLNQAAAPGTFPATAAAYPSGGSYPVGLAVGDVDGDGWPDLVVGHQYSQQVGVLLNRGAAAPGHFGPAQLYATGHDTRGVALGDVNGDGRPDVVASTSGSTVSVLLNQASRPGTLGPAVDYACGGRLNESLALGDVDGDGRLDIVVANNADNTVSVLRNAAAAPGTFPSVTTAATGGQVPRSLVLGDVNGDGLLDIVVANALSSTLGVLRNSTASPGTFPAPAEVYAQPGAGAVGVAVGDVDGDGRADLVTANYLDAQGSSVGVLRNAAQGFVLGPTLASGSTAPHSVVMGDLDGDGQLDVAVAHLSGRVGVLLSRGSEALATTPAGGGTASPGLYPNPTRAGCTLTGLGPGTAVVVLDGLGREVVRGVTDSKGALTLLLPVNLAAGNYLVRAGAQTLRLVRE